MRNRFGIKGGVVVDLKKKTQYPILSYWHSKYLIPHATCQCFAVRTRVQTFLRDGLRVW